MAFTKKVWEDRQSEFPNRRKLNPTGVADTYEVARDEGLIIKEGNPFNALTMNDLENRVDTAITDIPSTPLTMTAPITAGGTQVENISQVRNAVILPSGTTNFSTVENNTIIFVKK